jgi:integrase
MDRSPAPTTVPARTLSIPRGVSLRQFDTEQRIQIAFSYRGQQCRELLPPQVVTQTAINQAAGLRNEVRRRIELDTFVYADYFPGSPRGVRFANKGGRALVGKLLDNLLEAYEFQVRNGTLSPSTFDGYRKAINSDRMKHWRPMAVADVAPSMLREWISGLGVTAKFARNLMTPLRGVFDDALNDGLITINPFDRIALGKLLRKTSKASDYEVDPFTAAERVQLVEAARLDEAPMLRFWFATGLRPGELFALRWNRIDWQSRTARIDVNHVAGVDKSPKTAAGVRDVDLDEEAIAALIAQKPATFQAADHVWHNPRTRSAWGTDAQLRKTLWQPLCDRAGVRYRNPYQVRHTFASAALTAGANPWYMAEQLGHVDVQMVFKVYAKFIKADYLKPKTQQHGLRLVHSGEP